VEPVSAVEMADRLRQSLRKLLGWAEGCEPRMLDERLRYDGDLDEAEDLLEEADMWMAANVDRVKQSGDA
jgi:hypothetical protein